MNVPTCQQCGEEFASKDARSSSWTNSETGVIEQHWHNACWNRHVTERAAESDRSLKSDRTN